jgi:microcystin-dependent protein
MDQFVAEIRLFPFNFAPRGWALCDGQILPISQNTALFSLLGTMYGGDGKSTFALPNLQGSVPLGQGQGSGLPPYFPGESAGEPFVTLQSTEMPSHNHTLNAHAQDNATVFNPGPTVVPAGAVGGFAYNNNSPPQFQTQFAPTTIGFAGNSQPHNNMQPYLTLNFCIALQGVFPPRT